MWKKVVFGAALALGLSLTAGAAHAGGYHGHAAHAGGYHGHSVGHGRPYYATAGVRFSGGYYYKGQSHSHWGPRVWNARYNRYHYWDPNLSCYYYWSPAQSCYFPVGVPAPF